MAIPNYMQNPTTQQAQSQAYNPLKAPVKDQLFYKLKNNLTMAQNTPDLYTPQYIDAFAKGQRLQMEQGLQDRQEALAAQKNAQGMGDSGVMKYLAGQQRAAAHNQLGQVVNAAQNQMLQANYQNKQQQIWNAINFLNQFAGMKEQRRMEMIQQLMAAEQARQAQKQGQWNTLMSLAGLGLSAAGL